MVREFLTVVISQRQERLAALFDGRKQKSPSTAGQYELVIQVAVLTSAPSPWSLTGFPWAVSEI